MPSPAKGIRLWLRPASDDAKATWIIRDGSKQVRTRCAAGDYQSAKRKLEEYQAEKYRPERKSTRDPAAIPIDDVINIYLADKGKSIGRPAELGQRAFFLRAFFGLRKMADINGALCRDYVKHRGSETMARRELEDLRAAINHHRKEGLCNAIIEVVLPPKSPSRERWLTRSEAARMIWAAWRYREVQKGHATGRASRKHIARFILVGVYTGTRSGAICGAAIRPAIGRGHVNLEEGKFYRRAHGARVTKKRQPAINIPPRLLAHLRRWERLGISKHSVIEFAGKPVSSVRKAFASVARDVGLKDVTPHILRHTAATWAMQNGAPLYKAADFLGMTTEVLDRVYGHHDPDHHKEVGEAITGRTVSAQNNREQTAAIASKRNGKTQ